MLSDFIFLVFVVKVKHLVDAMATELADPHIGTLQAKKLLDAIDKHTRKEGA